MMPDSADAIIIRNKGEDERHNLDGGRRAGAFGLALLNRLALSLDPLASEDAVINCAEYPGCDRRNDDRYSMQILNLSHAALLFLAAPFAHEFPFCRRHRLHRKAAVLHQRHFF